jgi:hypothetical protein
MKRLLLSVFCAMAVISGHAQSSFTTVFSEPFEEPDALDSKVVQAANGNTFLFSFTKKDGIQVLVFDKSRKQVASTQLQGSEKTWHPEDMIGGMFSGVSRGSSVSAIYPVGDKMVLFLEQISDKQPGLYRIVLNASDGKLVSETKIHEMPAYAGGSAYAMAFGHVKPKGYHVERDPATGAYAVLAFDGFAPETAKRLELIHYNTSNEEIGRQYYDAPENRYKYINYLGMVVDGNSNVSLATYCYNGEGAGGSKIFLSRLQKNAFEHHALDFSANLKDTRGSLIYNPVTKHLELITLSEVSIKPESGGLKHIIKTAFVTIDPSSYAILSNKIPNSQLVSKYRKQRYDKDEERYTGVPMNIVVNADGTTTIVYEDQIPRIRMSSDIGMNIMKSQMAKHNNVFINPETSVADDNILKDIGITDYDENSNEQNGYVVRKLQRTKAVIPPLSHADMRNNRVTFDVKRKMWDVDANTGFYSFDYISTASGRYAIFNDHPKNFERDAEKNPKMLQGVSDANTICYKFADGELSKCYFFGEPDKSFNNRFALISSGDYSAATGDYAVLMIEKTGRRDKQARIAWAHLQ